MSRVMLHGIDGESMDAAENQVDALRYARDAYPRATHVVLLPGDAVPAVRAVDYRPLAGVSVTGAQNLLAYIHEVELVAAYGDGWFVGPPWVQLAGSHVASIIMEWPNCRQFFADWHHDMWNEEHGHARDTPECQAIHTILHGILGVPVQSPGECIVEETLESVARPCGCDDPPLERLVCRYGPILRDQFGLACEDSITVAFRGVHARVRYAQVRAILASFGVL